MGFLMLQRQQAQKPLQQQQQQQPFQEQQLQWGGGGRDLAYARVLCDTDLSLSDRTAVAAIFLPRQQLQAFVNRELDRCCATGDLEGMLHIVLFTCPAV
jgi:hypothetical protein